MRARSALLLVVFLGTVVGCNNNPSVQSGSNANNSGPQDNPNVDVGKELYQLKGAPVFPALPVAGTEPIVIANCYVQYEDRQQVAAEVEGTIDLIASPLRQRPDGRFEWKQADGTVVVHDPARPHPSIVFHPRDIELNPLNREKWIPYWKLADGHVVAAGQVLCLIDDQMVTTKKKHAERMREAATAVRDEAQKGVGYVKDKIKLYEKNMGVIAPAQVLDDLTTLSRFQENLAQSTQAIVKAEQDFDEAQLMIVKHRITSRVDGIIRNVAKRPGEYIRPGEKIFDIQSTEKVRIEGNLAAQYARRLRPDMPVTVEPAIPSAPVASNWGHRQEVGGIAVTGHAGRPLIVSAGLDGSVLVWDPNLAGAKDRQALPHNLPHPVAVRAVACTPPGAQAMLAVTGASDGRVRIWDLGDPAKLPTKPQFEPTDFHLSGVTAVAVSPDGRFAATAAGREVFVWDLALGKKLYSLPPEHRDSVTSLAFTPQGQLVTAAKDRTVKVWKLGEGKAAVARTVEHRAGVVDALGVSPDGGRMLFDQDKGRLDIVNLSDGQTVGQLSNVGPNVAFATLAVFGPDRAAPDTPIEQLPPYTVVTAGGEGDLKGGLQ